MMSSVRTALFAFLAIVAAGLVPSVAHAQAPCLSPGQILDVPTPGFLKNSEPDLVIDFERGGYSVPVVTVMVTTSRLRIVMPSTGLLSDADFKVRHVEDSGATKVIASGRTCVIGPLRSGEGSSGAGSDSARQARVRLSPATRFDVVAPSGAPEFVLMGSPAAVSRAEGVVLQTGGAVLRRRGLNALGLGMSLVDLRGTQSLAELRSELARRSIDVGAGRHNVYGLSQGSAGYARGLVTGSDAAPCRLGRNVRVGIIDGPVNTRHPALQGASIETATILDRQDNAASADHGTGIAGLIASPEFGIAPGVTLFAVTAVSRAGPRELAKLEDIAAALDWMVSRNIDIVNMSLAGPSNAALGRAIGVASDRGIILVAAVGNDRRQDVAYPASDPRVIAVTAIDADKRIYRRASTGAAVDFAAPGVDLRVPTARRMAFRSGTSYASAALTALIAIEMGNGAMRSDRDIRRALEGISEDLGPAGRDREYGIGFPRRSGC